MIKLCGLRVAGLYLLLKQREEELDDCLKDFSGELEAYLYDRLSIEEMEELGKLYRTEDVNLSSKI